jgi:hypothetical protein
LLPLLESTLEQAGFTSKDVVGNTHGFKGTLGQLSTKIWTKGSLHGTVLLISAGVHGPEGLAARHVLTQLIHAGIFDDLPAGVEVIVVPDACPDSVVTLNGQPFRVRDIPLYGTDGEPIGAWVDPNRACTPADNGFWTEIEAQSQWIKSNWHLLVPNEYHRSAQERASKMDDLRSRCIEDLLSKEALPALWQRALLMELIRGQIHDPYGLFYCGSSTLTARQQEFNFLRDVLVRELATHIGTRAWRATDIHTGLPNSLFLTGATPEHLQATLRDLDIKGGVELPMMIDRFGEMCMLIPSLNGGDFLGSLAAACPKVLCAFGLEFTQADETHPWAPFPGANTPDVYAAITAEHMLARDEAGTSEVDNMIHIAMARRDLAEGRDGAEEALYQAYASSQTYFGFGLPYEPNHAHLDRMKRFVALTINFHLASLIQW